MFVAGISCTRPKTRAFVTERTWAYQTKSAFSDTSYIVSWRSTRNEKGTALAAPCLSHSYRLISAIDLEQARAALAAADAHRHDAPLGLATGAFLEEVGR
ncbi:hypothetical protein ACVWWR_001833 [Bradyrhizobium sp. LM3.2]